MSDDFILQENKLGDRLKLLLSDFFASTRTQDQSSGGGENKMKRKISIFDRAPDNFLDTTLSPVTTPATPHKPFPIVGPTCDIISNSSEYDFGFQRKRTSRYYHIAISIIQVFITDKVIFWYKVPFNPIS